MNVVLNVHNTQQQTDKMKNKSHVH